LNPLGPIMGGPGIQQRTGGALYRAVHSFLSTTLADAFKLFRR
jgi:hypothetical protein